MKTFDAAKGHWHEILPAYGMSREVLDGKHHPCPLCGVDKDWFRFDDRDGKGTVYCNGCGAKTGIDVLIAFTGKDFQTVCHELDRMLGNTHEGAPQPQAFDPRPTLNRIRREACPLDGTDPASLYLANRGVMPSPALRWHPRLAHKEGGRLLGHYPALLGVVTSPEGQPITYHRTYLQPDGSDKAPIETPKKCLPGTRKLTGGAIRLNKPTSQLCVAEGIESALCAGEQFGMPAWATLNANLMAKLEVPAEVERVLIVADHDRNFTGHAAAYELARRLSLRGISPEVYMPPTPGFDVLDTVGAQRASPGEPLRA